MSGNAGSHNPMTQFEVHPLVDFHLGSLNLSFTNASLWMLISIFGVMWFMYMGLRNVTLVPSRWQSLVEVFVQFISDTVRENTGKEGLKYFPAIFTIFMFVLASNLAGMLPFSFTVTSHIIVTFTIAACIFLSCILIAITKHGFVSFAQFFMPSGAPLWLAPLLIPIELFSFLARPVSLSIRLAANMMAGHILLKVLAGFVLALGLVGGWAPLAFLVLMTGFEIGICVLQAYVFTILTCVYLNDALHLH